MEEWVFARTTFCGGLNQLPFLPHLLSFRTTIFSMTSPREVWRLLWGEKGKLQCLTTPLWSEILTGLSCKSQDHLTGLMGGLCFYCISKQRGVDGVGLRNRTSWLPDGCVELVWNIVELFLSSHEIVLISIVASWSDFCRECFDHFSYMRLAKVNKRHLKLSSASWVENRWGL